MLYKEGKITKGWLRLILAAVVGFFVLSLDSAQAATNLFGPPEGGILSLSGSPYVVMADITVNNGNTLTIEPGVVVKMQANRAIILLNGTITIGSASDSNQVVITSYYDDSYGGDANNDGSATAPAAGDWKYLQVSSTNSQITINNALIRYGGFNSSMVQILSGARATIANTIIEYSNDTGLGIRNGDSSLTLTNSIIRNNVDGLTVSFQADATVTGTTFSSNRRGIAIDTDADVAHLTISGNTFSGNTRVYGSVPFAGLDYDDPNDTLTVTNNNWGSSTGPTHSGNPSGTGDKITGDGTVSYSPWTGQNQAPALSYVGASGYTADGVEPNVSFKTQTLPLFKVAYSDPENVVSYVRIIVASSTFSMATSTGGIYTYTPIEGMFAKGTYSYHFEASDGTNSVRLPASGELSFEVRNTPVLLVPGIMGTEMWKGSDKIWADTLELLTPSDNFMNVLIMNQDGTSNDNQITTGDILRAAPFTDVFASLISQLSGFGYIENMDLFTAPYDWRLDVKVSSDDLKTAIDTVKNQTGSNKINIIAHSLGGLLAKQYVLDNNKDFINKLIFIGTPNLGAPKAAKTLLFGDNLNIRILNAERVKYISQNMLSVYELLPSRAYIDQEYYYYDHTQSDVFDYDRTKQFLTDFGLNSILLQSADNFHSSALDNFNTAGLDAYNINGCNTPTITTLMKRSNSEYAMFLYEGDGTVPLMSSKAINVGANKTYYFKDIEHATMPSATGIKDLVTDIITGSTINLPSNATQDSSVCKVIGDLVSIHSPVNLHIYDSSGNHVGRGENGDIEYEISGVAYEEIGENKFVFLPTSGGQTYRVTLDGTGSGTFSLRVSKVENNEITQTAYYSNLPVNTSTEATVTLADDISNTILQVDQNGTGSFTTAPVSAVLNATQSADITQPSSTITVSGGLISSTVSLSATDDNAGILKIEYSLDNGTTWQQYSSSFIINTVGTNTIQYRATDRAGNVESAKSRTIQITMPNAVVPYMSPLAESTPQVLGEQIERPKNEQYTADQILGALAAADTDVLLDYLGKSRDVILEEKVTQDYGKYLVLDKAAVNFIVYGTKSTAKLGLGERAGVLRSYQYAFGKLPQTSSDWQDAVNIATNQLPNQRNLEREKEAQVIVKKIYGRLDNNADMAIAYGLRPVVRDINKEKSGLSRFGKIFGKMPESVFEWNVFRKLVY